MQTCPDASMACPVPFRFKRWRGMEVDIQKTSDRQVWKLLALGVVPGDGTEVRGGNTYEQGESGRGERR
jgi:hypothetical protein